MADTNKITYVSLDNLSYYDEKIKKYINDADALIQTAVDEEVIRAKAAELTNAQAAETAQNAANQAQSEVDALEAYVGTFTASSGVDTVVKYIDAKTANIASDETVNALGNRVTQAEKDIDALETRATNLETAVADRYTKSEIDTKVETLTEANGNNQTALQSEVDRAKGEEARIEGLVTAETSARENADKALADRLVEVEAFFKLAEGESLNTALDTLVEIQNYLDTEGSAADQMVLDIAANAKAIEDEATARANADTTLQGNIDKKADAETVEAIDARVGALETASATHATKTELQAVSDVAEAAQTEDEVKAIVEGYEYETVANVTNKISGIQTQIDNLGNTYATDAEVEAVRAAEVTRADAAYAAKSLEDTVGTHLADAIAHITAAERTKWNGAVSDLATHKTAYNAKVAELAAEDAAIRQAFATADSNLETALKQYTDTAKSDAKAYTDEQVGAFNALTTTEIDGLFA